MMKKLFTTIILAIVAVMGYAQTNPNRMLVTDKTGSTKGYLVERIDSVSFVSLEGRVAADVEYKGITAEPPATPLLCLLHARPSV